MFLPLSLSIGLTLIVSYILAQTGVPILSNWLIKAEQYEHYYHGEIHAHAGEALNLNEETQQEKHLQKEKTNPKRMISLKKIKLRFMQILQNWMPKRSIIVITYLIGMIVLAGLCFV